MGCEWPRDPDREKGYTGVAITATAHVQSRLFAIFLSMFLPTNLPGGVSIDLSTYWQSRLMHQSLASLAIRAHSYSIRSLFRGPSPISALGFVWNLVCLSVLYGSDHSQYCRFNLAYSTSNRTEYRLGFRKAGRRSPRGGQSLPNCPTPFVTNCNIVTLDYLPRTQGNILWTMVVGLGMGIG